MDHGRPEEPTVQDCCHNGCSPCVYDIYEKRLADWSKKTQAETSSFKIRTDLLSVTVFKPFVLKSKATHAKDVWLLKFQALSDRLDGRLPYRAGQHVVLRHPESSGEKFITRDYTVIPSESDDDQCGFTVIIKVYSQGTMSSYVKGLTVGSVTRWRGPVGDFNYAQNSYKRVVMTCMGTGVVPMYAVARDIVENECDETFVDLVYGCQSVDHLVLRDRLKGLLNYWNFRSLYCFSDSTVAVENKRGENFVMGRINEKIISSFVQSFEQCLVLICGSDTFCADIESIFCKIVPGENIVIF